jgi:hypothetical protein
VRHLRIQKSPYNRYNLILLYPIQLTDPIGMGIGYFYSRIGPEQKITGIRTDSCRAGESEGAVVNSLD